MDSRESKDHLTKRKHVPLNNYGQPGGGAGISCMAWGRQAMSGST